MDGLEKLFPDPGQSTPHQVIASCPLGVEWSSTVTANHLCHMEVCVVTISQLPDALRDDRSQIILYVRVNYLPGSFYGP